MITKGKVPKKEVEGKVPKKKVEIGEVEGKVPKKEVEIGRWRDAETAGAGER